MFFDLHQFIFPCVARAAGLPLFEDSGNLLLRGVVEKGEYAKCVQKPVQLDGLVGQ